MCFKSSFIYRAVLILILISASIVTGDTVNDRPRIFFDLSTEGFYGLENTGPAGFSDFKAYAESLGYAVEDTSLAGSNFAEIIISTSYLYANNSINDTSNSTGKIEVDITDAIAIVNPRRELSRPELTRLNRFVARGGSLIVVCDTPDSIYPSNLLLSDYGILFEREYLLDIEPISGESFILDHAIPLKVTGTDEGNITILDGVARISRDLLTGSEQYGQKKSILMAIGSSGGRVIAMGSKEPFTNSRLDEERRLIHYILSMIDPGDSSLGINVSFAPSRIAVPLIDNKLTLTALILENHGLNSINISFIIPENLKDVLVLPAESSFSLESGEEASIDLLFSESDGRYGYRESTLFVQVVDEFSRDEEKYKIPVTLEGRP